MSLIMVLNIRYMLLLNELCSCIWIRAWTYMHMCSWVHHLHMVGYMYLQSYYVLHMLLVCMSLDLDLRTRQMRLYTQVYVSPVLSCVSPVLSHLHGLWENELGLVCVYYVCVRLRLNGYSKSTAGVDDASVVSSFSSWGLCLWDIIGGHRVNRPMLKFAHIALSL